MKNEIEILVEEVAELTSSNNHTLAVRAIAQFVGDGESVDVCDWIEDDHSRLGYLSETWIKERSAILKLVLIDFAEQCGDDALHVLRGAL